MTSTLIRPKATILSLLLGGLFLFGLAEAGATQGHGGHGSHDGDHAAPATADSSKNLGDPYALTTDPVSGKKLGKLDSQVVIRHEGREFRFANEKNSKAFKKDPAKYITSVDAKIVKAQGKDYPLTTCPISGGKLGGMGDPIDLVVGNRLVRVCCKGCIKKVKADPSAVIAKLDAAVIKRQGPGYAMTTCPVTGEKLGGMGDSIDVVIGNQLVRVCCKMCVKKVKADPVKYLAEVSSGAKKDHAEGHGDHDH